MNAIIKWGFVGLLLLGTGTGVIYLIYEYGGPRSIIQAPDISKAQSRQAIPVPEVRFTDITQSAGITFKHSNGNSGKKLLPETMGAGVATFDVNKDGKPDLFFVNSNHWPGASSNEAPVTCHLYLNQGNGTFIDVTQTYGLNIPMYGQGCTFGDFDNDGWSDLFISCVGKHRLFRNIEGKRFVDVTDIAGVGGKMDLPQVSREEFLKWKDPIPWGSSCTFLDYDGDGRLDLFVCHYVTWSPQIDQNIDATLGGTARAYAPPKDFDGAHCSLYRNVDGTRFVDVSKEAGVQVFPTGNLDPNLANRPLGKSLGLVVCDPDQDGWPDILVANDTVQNFFFHNIPGPDGGRRFEECAKRCGAAYPDEGKARGGMGIDWAQFRADFCAVVIANFANEPDTFLLFRNPKMLICQDAALSVGLSGPSRGPLKFGTFFFDYDLDGRPDLLTTNGHIEPDITTIYKGQTFAQPAQLFWNTGETNRLFEPVTAKQSGEDIFKPIVGRGSAFADFDGDGDLDVILTANNGIPLVLKNDNNLKNNWIRLTLDGDGLTSNRTAIGAQVKLEADGETFYQYVAGARSYLSQSEPTLTFGLGKRTKVDRVTITWPGKDHKQEVWTDLAINKSHILNQGKGK